MSCRSVAMTVNTLGTLPYKSDTQCTAQQYLHTNAWQYNKWIRMWAKYKDETVLNNVAESKKKEKKTLLIYVYSN